MKTKVKLNIKPVNYWPNRWLNNVLRNSLRPCLLSGLILLSGCQGLPPLFTDLDTAFEIAVERHRFQQAQTVLEKQLKNKQLSHTQYQQQQKQLTEADRQHSLAVLKQANAEITASRWYAAETLLLTAERHSIAPHAFSSAFKRLTEEENQRLNTLHLNTKMAKMVWLRAEEKNLKTLNQSTLQSPISRLNQLINRLNIRHTNRALFHCAQSNFDSNHLVRAKTCFSYIDPENLSPRLMTEFQILNHYFAKKAYANRGQANESGKTPGYPPLSKDPHNIAKTDSKKNRPESAERSTKNKQARLKKLLQQLEVDLENVNLLDIKTTLEKIEALGLAPNLEAKKRHQAKQFLNNQITKLDQRAENFYSNERISQAHSIWEYLLKLDPNNTAIRQKQDRSQRVLEKMRELREEQPPKHSIADVIEGPWQ